MQTFERDEYATNWHNYEKADEIVQTFELLLTQLIELQKKLERTYVINNCGEVIMQAKKLEKGIWYLRRMCDQHAG